MELLITMNVKMEYKTKLDILNLLKKKDANLISEEEYYKQYETVLCGQVLILHSYRGLFEKQLQVGSERENL
jgi:hypothetical protein